MSRDVGPGQEMLFGAPERVGNEPVATAMPTVVVATDGSCLRNPGPGGWCWFVDGGRWAAGGERDTTNNRMELLAVLEALTAVPRDHALLVRADSSYTIDACTKWIHGWKRRGWKTAQGAAVKNREIIEAIDLALATRTVTFEWVKGHAGHALNEAADARCRAAAESVQRARVVDTGPGWAGRE
jgi:ribonuclease HI